MWDHLNIPSKVIEAAGFFASRNEQVDLRADIICEGGSLVSKLDISIPAFVLLASLSLLFSISSGQLLAFYQPLSEQHGPCTLNKRAPGALSSMMDKKKVLRFVPLLGSKPGQNT